MISLIESPVDDSLVSNSLLFPTYNYPKHYAQN